MNALSKVFRLALSPRMQVQFARWLVAPSVAYRGHRITGFGSFGAFYHAGTLRPSLSEDLFIARQRAAAPDAPVFDVGANLGFFTIALCNAGAGPVHSFEPVPTTFSALESNCRGLKNAILNSCAVGEASGQVIMTNDLRSPAINR